MPVKPTETKPSRLPDLERIERKWSHVEPPADLELNTYDTLSTLTNAFDVLGHAWADSSPNWQPYPMDKEFQLRTDFSDAMKKCFLVGLDYSHVHSQTHTEKEVLDDESDLVLCACEPVMNSFLSLVSEPKALERDRPTIIDLYKLVVTEGYQSLLMGRKFSPESR